MKLQSIAKESSNKRFKELEKCNICPRKCNISRYSEKGVCKAGEKVKVALANIHMFEEPCISAINGSGTIFFSNCNLRCVYCQNSEISEEGKGREITIEELSAIMLRLQNKFVNNINLVTPTMYVLQIIEAIKIAKENGLHIPIIYNSSGYESKNTIKMLEGYIDVYLPDFKYSNNVTAKKYSACKNYVENAIESIGEMLRQKPENIINSDGIIEKGVIIRHMILPSLAEESKEVLDIIKKNFGVSVTISIMAQYFPTYKAKDYPEINRKITKKELEHVYEYARILGLYNGYIQDVGKHEEEYVPDFNLSLFEEN